MCVGLTCIGVQTLVALGLPFVYDSKLARALPVPVLPPETASAVPADP